MLASEDVLGDFLRVALPGHVHREALSGPPERALSRQTAHNHEYDEFCSFCSNGNTERQRIQALVSQTPGRIPWGESAPGHGKAPWTSARGGTGARAPSVIRDHLPLPAVLRGSRGPPPQPASPLPLSAAVGTSRRPRSSATRTGARALERRRAPPRPKPGTRLVGRDSARQGPPGARGRLQNHTSVDMPSRPRRPRRSPRAHPATGAPANPAPPQADVSAARRERSRAPRHPCRSGAGDRCGSPAP